MESVLIAILFGYILILIEGFLPGGIFGFAGAVCILVATYFAHIEFGGYKVPFLVLLFGSFGGLAIVFLEFKWLAKSKFGKSIFLSAKTNGISNEKPPNTDIIGEVGKTLTEMKPEGIVLLNGRDYDAYSEDGLIPADQKVSVTGIDDFRIRVNKIN